MMVIVKQRMGFNTQSYYNIVNIAYDTATSTYTLTDIDENETEVNGSEYYVFIMINNAL